MDNKTAVSYKFYDKTGSRLAAFCRQVDESTHEIFILRCNKKDQFSKKLAKQVYKLYTDTGGELVINEQKYHPTIIHVKKEGLDGTLKTLLKFLALNFTVGIYEYEMTKKEVLNLYNPLTKQCIKTVIKT